MIFMLYSAERFEAPPAQLTMASTDPATQVDGLLCCILDVVLLVDTDCCACCASNCYCRACSIAASLSCVGGAGCSMTVYSRV